MPRPTRWHLEVLLARHIGRANGVTAQQLAAMLECSPRLVRKFVTKMREAGRAVCGKPDAGYFIAETAEELKETCAFLRSRAMHSLSLEAKLRRMPLADLIGQLHLKT